MLRTIGNFKPVSVCLVLLFLISTVLVTLPACQAISRSSIKDVHLIISPISSGTVTCTSEYKSHNDADQIYYFDSSSQKYATFVAQPNDGKAFLGWYIDGVYDGNFTVITIPVHDCYLRAAFSTGYYPEDAENQQQSKLINTLTWAIVILLATVSVLSVILYKSVISNRRKK